MENFNEKIWHGSGCGCDDSNGKGSGDDVALVVMTATKVGYGGGANDEVWWLERGNNSGKISGCVCFCGVSGGNCSYGGDGNGGGNNIDGGGGGHGNDDVRLVFVVVGGSKQFVLQDIKWV